MTERGVASRLGSPTAIILGLCVASYGVMLLSGGTKELSAISSETLMRFGAAYAPLVREGQVHRLLASTFLHLNPLHLLLNCVALWIVGPRAEEAFGRWRFTGIFLLTALGASLVSLAWHWSVPAVSAGASGALCGLIAAVAYAAHRERRQGELGAMLMWLGATLVFGVLIRADNAAHLGGLVVGAALSWTLYAKRKTPTPTTAPSAVIAVVALAALATATLTRNNAETAAMLVNRGVEHARAGNDEEASLLYRRAIQLEPKDSIAHYDLGLALMRMDQYDEAIVTLERALALEDNEQTRQALATAHLNRGVALARDGRLDDAIVAYRRSLTIHDGAALGHYNVGLALARKGDTKAALAAFRRAHALTPDPRHTDALVDALNDEGLSLADEGQHQNAIALFREASRLAPSAWRPLLGLGLSLTELGQHDEAVKVLERAVKLDGDAQALDGLSAALEARRDKRERDGDLSGALDDIADAALLRLAPKR